MTRKVIYISKSKVGNPDDLMKVRHLLKSLDCEVTEFFGGKYTTKDLDRADILIMVPAKLDGHQHVGKGQFDEGSRWIEDDTKVFYPLMVTHIEGKELNFEVVMDMVDFHPSVANWGNKFGYARLEGVPWTLDEICDNQDIAYLEPKSKATNLRVIASKYLKS